MANPSEINLQIVTSTARVQKIFSKKAGAVIGPLLLPQFIQFVLRPSDEQHADRSIDSDSTTFPEDNVSEADDPDYVLPEDSVRARDSELSRDDGSAHQHDTRSQRRRHAA